MSDTKRTDAMDSTVQGQNWGYKDMRGLARTLERELEQAQSELARLRPLLECQRIDLAKVGGPFKKFWEKAQACPVYWQEAAVLADDEYRRCEAENTKLKAQLDSTLLQLLP